MPSISDPSGEELSKIDVVLKILEDNFGKIHNPAGDGNCGYYALFHAFKFMGKNLKKRKLPGCAQSQKTAKTKRKELLKFGLDNLTYFVWHHNVSASPKLIQLLPDGHSHIFGLYGPNLVTDQDKINAFMETIGNSMYTKEFEDHDNKIIDEKFYIEALWTFPHSVQVEN